MAAWVGHMGGEAMYGCIMPCGILACGGTCSPAACTWQLTLYFCFAKSVVCGIAFSKGKTGS